MYDISMSDSLKLGGARRATAVQMVEALAETPAAAETPSLAMPLGPRSQGADKAELGHGGARHGVAALRSSTSPAALSAAKAELAKAKLAAPIDLRRQIMADPRVQAALARVPGMRALKLEQLSPRTIELGALGATETAKLLKSGKLTATEVVSAAIERAKAGEHLGLVDHPLYAEALAAAKQMDADKAFDKPFSGVPMVIKANVKLEGAPTSYGSRSTPDTANHETSPHLKDYLDLGIIPIFLGTTSEFGFNGVTEPVGKPPTRNPHNPEHTAGGSSGGSAVAVASGIVPFAHGTDGGGSCRIPASLTGIIGYKPSRARLKLLDGAEKLPVIINTPGVLARNPEDVTRAMKLLDNGKAAGMGPLGDVSKPPSRPLKIAYYVDPLGGKAESETRAAMLDMVDRLLGLGHTVTELEKPPYTQKFIDDFLAVYRVIAWAVGNKLEKGATTDASKLEPFSKGLGDRNMLQALWTKYVNSGRIKGQHTKRYEEVFEEHDLLLNPTVPGDAPRIGELSPAQSYDQMIDKLMDLVQYTPLQNGTGGPAVSIPAGKSDDGLPLGLQFSAKPGADTVLLQMVHQVASEKSPGR